MRGRWMLAVGMVAALGLGVGKAYAQDAAQPQAGDEPQAGRTAAGEVAPADEYELLDEGDQPLGDEDAMVLNFERADIREVIHSLATALGVSYTIDPRIEGQVTIRTIGKISREDLFPLFNQILRNNGIAAVKVGDIYQVVPVAEAKTRAIIPRGADARRVREDDSFVIQIVALKHVAGDEMVALLQPFITPGGDVLAYPRANVLVVTDLRSNVGRIRELVEAFDTNVFADLHARVFKVINGDPEELAEEIVALLAPYGVTPTGEGEGGAYLVALPRMSMIVGFTLDPTIFAEIDRWLKLLDIPAEEGSGRQIFVYHVENTKAADLAAVLNELFGEGGRGGGGSVVSTTGGTPAGVGLFGAGGVSGGRAGGAFGRGRGGAGVRGGRSGISGGAFGQQAGGALGSRAGAAIGQQAAANTAAARRQRVRAARQARQAGGVGAAPAVAGRRAGSVGALLVPGRTGRPGEEDEPPPIFKEEVRIVADEVTNSLVILATKRDFQLILDVVKRIDVVPRQVLLEVTIAEVTLTNDLQFGIAWAIAEGNLNATQPEGDANSIFRTGPRGLPVGGLIGGASRLPAGGGGFAVISDREHYNIFINALQNRTNVKMLSAPHIIAADNREAHILVGDEIPILTGASQSLAQGAVGQVTFTNVQYRDTGTILTILPQVNSRGLVNMQVRQEVSAVQERGGQQVSSFGETGSPAFTSREAETTLVVQDGDTVVIGGIINDAVAHTRNGIPFFMDIPVLGRIFRSETDRVLRTELIVLITPYVMRSRDEALEVSAAFGDRVEGLRRLRAAMGVKLPRYSGQRTPEPPSVEEPIEITPLDDEP